VNRSVIDRIVSAIGAVLGVVLLVAAGLLFYAHNYVHDQVRTQLQEQKVVFPTADSKGLTSLPAADQTAMREFAGQTLSTGEQAHTYSEHFIKVHLAEVAQGQTYSQVSSKAQADPTNQQLAGQVQTLFRGETLRGLLLNAYAFDMMAKVALIAAWVSIVAALALFALAALGLRHARQAKPGDPAVAARQQTARTSV
jgi:spore germination protein GerM